jgi:3-oxoacid CoA-transferase A subunit
MKRIDKIMSAGQALARVKDGQRVMVGGFGLRGTPNALIDALVANGARNLTIISNDLGNPGVGLGKFLSNGQVKRLIGTYYSWNREAVDAYNRGEIDVDLVPQGTFAESIRAAGYGIPAYYALASAGTELGEGKEAREFDGRSYVMERAIHADVALIQACRADRIGNLVYCKTARNFNPLMAMAARYTVALVDEIVEPGELDPECIVTPHVFVQAIVKE